MGAKSVEIASPKTGLGHVVVGTPGDVTVIKTEAEIDELYGVDTDPASFQSKAKSHLRELKPILVFRVGDADGNAQTAEDLAFQETMRKTLLNAERVYPVRECVSDDRPIHSLDTVSTANLKVDIITSRLKRQIEDLQAQLAKVTRDHDTMFANLGHVQAKCTEQEETIRRFRKAFSDKPVNVPHITRVQDILVDGTIIWRDL